MSRESELARVQELAKKIKQPIPVKRFALQKHLRDEVIDAYISPVPSAVKVNGKQKMVEKGDWLIIKEDGSSDTYKKEEFAERFEQCPDKVETPPAEITTARGGK